MAREFTEPQKQAIESNARDICVSAGAGSGKTGVLVERFLRIVTESLSGTLPVSDRANVSEILVVTFTDRATKEMKSRIVEALNARGLIEERRQLETAYISTIHGLCSRLLKEHPFEAGVDPGFTVLDEAGSQRMIKSAFNGVISEGYRSRDTGIMELVAEVIEDPTFKGSDLDAFPLLALEAEVVMRKLRGAGASLDEIKMLHQVGRTPEFSADPINTLLHPTFTELTACIGELQSMSAGSDSNVHRAAAYVLNTVARMSTGADAVTRIGNVQTMSAAAAKARTIVRSPQTAGKLMGVLDRIKSACEQVSDLYGVSHEREKASRLKCGRFIGLVCSTWESYATAKRSASLLDNDDLLAKCVRMLEESTSVLHRCQRQFKHLMVDEFQDTDIIQARLLELLHVSNVRSSVRHLYHNSDTDVSLNSLFIVGDSQQSIYGFRNADPQIFCKIEAGFRASGQALHVQMNDNFRSRPEILSLIQQVFDSNWRHDSTPYVPLRSAAEFRDKLSPSIEILVTSNMARREYVHFEADAIARHIRTVVEDPGRQITISAHNDARCGLLAEYGDITILLRGLTDIHVYEEAFARRGVPALVTSGGRGYYARFEIQDILSVLTVLDSPLNDLALLAALRSPFVGADVDTLYRLNMVAGSVSNGKHSGQDRGPLYPAIQLLLESPDIASEERDKIESFFSAMEKLRVDVDRISVARLLERLIVATNYDMRLVCRPGGRRKLANVRKLVQFALAEPGLSVCEFVSRMRQLQVLSDREGDAPTAEEGAGVVRFMTIHSAKGLEFPIVVLPDLSRGLVAPETGLFTCDPVSRTIGARSNGDPDAAYRAIAKRKQESDKAEYLRLLYVAITRAQEHIILCGNVGRNRGFNWADVVFPALGISSAPAAAEWRTLNGGLEAIVSPLTPPNPTNGDATFATCGSSYEAGDRLADELLRVTNSPN